MEAVQVKAKLADERIQQIKSLLASIGTKQPDAASQLNVLEDENARLKKRIQDLVNKFGTSENQRGVTQQHDVENKISQTTTGATANPENSEAKDGKNKKKKSPKQVQYVKHSVHTAFDITRFDLRVGKVLSVEIHTGADALYVEQIDVGEEKPRTVCSGLMKHLQISDLDQKLVIVLCNLKPLKMCGVLSEGMLMCASTPEKIELLEPTTDCKPGDRVICDGFDCSSPDSEVKKELTFKILPSMKTNENREATCLGGLWRVGKDNGVIKSKTLVNAPIQ